MPAQRHCDTLQRGVNTTISGQLESLEASTSTENPKRYDCAVQTTLQQEVHHRQRPSAESGDAAVAQDLVSITKSEMESLENDMKLLRDAVRSKEEMWDQAVEREQNYREHLVRLSVELITTRQLSETRYNESQTLVQKITEKKEELRLSQKELILAKKAIMKLQKCQRNTEECYNSQEARNAYIGDNPSSREKQQQQQQQQQSRPIEYNNPVENQQQQQQNLLARQKFRRGSPRHHERSNTASPRIGDLVPPTQRTNEPNDGDQTAASQDLI